MRKERCAICGRGEGAASTTAEREYTVTFSGVCGPCASTLSRALGGFTEMLRQAHGERRERVLDRVVGRLEQLGFSTDSFPTGRRSA